MNSMNLGRSRPPNPFRVVAAEDSPPRARSELQTLGNQLLTDARSAALEALHESTTITLYSRKTYRIGEIRDLLTRTKTAIAAWSQVESALAELVHEYDKTRKHR